MLTNPGLPPDSLSVDGKRLYWTNEAQGIVGSVDKVTGDDFRAQSVDGVSFVIAFGDNLQPYPGNNDLENKRRQFWFC